MSALHSTADGLCLSQGADRSEHWLARTAALLRCWLARSRSRNLLAQMDERMLKDIGLSRADAVMEGAKHFWQR